MKRKNGSSIVLILLAVLVAAFVAAIYQRQIKGIATAILPVTKDITTLLDGQNNTDFPLTIPNGKAISIFADNLPTARDLEVDPNGVIFVSLRDEGAVVALIDEDKDFISEARIMVVEDAETPHGIAFSCNQEDKCFFYLAEAGQVSKYDYDKSTLKVTNKRQIINYSTGGRHTTSSILIVGDSLYTSIGSSCDACVEKDERRGSVLKSDLDGNNVEIYSSGLRNSVFLAKSSSNEVWATEMGRDFLGDDLPPDEINILEAGKFYGWPYCYGNKVQDNVFDKSGKAADICASSSPSRINLQAHSAPLGLAFMEGELLVSYHGSWNRSEPTGYKIVKFSEGCIKNTETCKAEDYIVGWLENGERLGRPVDILVNSEKIYISDDKAGVVYILKNI